MYTASSIRFWLFLVVNAMSKCGWWMTRDDVWWDDEMHYIFYRDRMWWDVMRCTRCVIACDEMRDEMRTEMHDEMWIIFVIIYLRWCDDDEMWWDVMRWWCDEMWWRMNHHIITSMAHTVVMPFPGNKPSFNTWEFTGALCSLQQHVAPGNFSICLHVPRARCCQPKDNEDRESPLRRLLGKHAKWSLFITKCRGTAR
jgi:hypothetical protein